MTGNCHIGIPMLLREFVQHNFQEFFVSPLHCFLFQFKNHCAERKTKNQVDFRLYPYFEISEKV